MTPEQQYQANLAFLANRPGMAHMPEQLQSFPLVNMHLQPGPTGNLFGQVWDTKSQTWAGLCNPTDPMAEAEADVNTIWSRNVKVFTLLGIGLGYFAVALAKRLEPWQRLVVWDLDPNMFKAMMYAIDIGPLFGSEGHKTDVFIGTEVLAQIEPWWMKLEAVEKLHLGFPLRAGYTTICLKADYDQLQEKTMEMMRFHAVGLSTWRQFGGCIGDNDLRNLPDYFLNPGYEHLKGLWEGKPAVCLAAGPSLQKNLRLLLQAQHRDRVALISVGTIYGLLHGLGLDPDIITTIDFQRLNWTDQFAQLPLDPACPLVYLHSTYPQTVRRWPGPKFVAENSSDTVAWLRQYGEGKKSAGQVQTVAHLNLLVALELGANPIILLGQDLAMPVTEHHAAGARAQDMAPQDAPEDAFVTVPDYQGKAVHTRHSFLSMKTVFERMIAEHPDRTVLNCSEGGIALAGAPSMPLAHALAQLQSYPAARGELRRQVRAVYQDYKPQLKETFAADWRQLRQWVEDLAQWAIDVETMANDARKADVPTAWLSVDIQAAQLASDCLSLTETRDDIVLGYWHRLLESERIIQERHAALALFAIRRFDFLELMAAIPPEETEIPTPLAKAVYNGKRLLAVAAMIREEAPTVQLLLRDADRRLEWIQGGFPWFHEDTVHRVFARQRYNLGLALVRDGTTAAARTTQGNPRGLRLYARYLYHTQQYEAAAVQYEQWGDNPQKVARIRRYLQQWHADVRAAMPAYFKDTGEHPPVATGEAWLYDA